MPFPRHTWWFQHALQFVMGAKPADYQYISNTSCFNQRNPELLERVRLEELEKGSPAPAKPFVEVKAEA